MALLPSRKITTVPDIHLNSNQMTFYENAISGDAIDGGKITNFSSTGIQDQADSQQITVTNDTIEVKNDLVVKGTVTVENLKYVEAQVPKLNVTEAVMIDHNEVIWKHELGRSVKKSNLEELGRLKNLNVKKTLFAKDGRVGINTEAPSAGFSVNVDGHEVITSMQERNAYVGTYGPFPFAIGTDDSPRLVCRSNGDVTIGVEDGKDITVNVYGRLGIGVKNPRESLHVNGNIRFADKVFSSGSGTPKEGRWDVGSVVWNDNPEINQPVGWVCLKGGTPGLWRSFGVIY
jgi:hypothetical protein